MTWLDDAARVPVVEVAARLGQEVRRHASSSSCPCPACGVDRRHKSRGDRRGAVGIPHKPGGWRCFECEAGGDAIDFVAYALAGARFRDLPASRRPDVRTWFEGAPGRAWSRVPAAAAAQEPDYPPLAEVGALWASCRPVNDVTAASGYLQFRGIDASVVAVRDLARALPAGRLPAWARLGARSWVESGHRLVVPLFDALGRMRSVLARSIERSPTLKSTAPRGFGRAGLLLADRLGRGMLEHGRAPRWWPEQQPFDIVVAEGEIDHLLWAARADRKAGPAVLSVVSGSWTSATAARIPLGAHVTIATDADAQGDKYADIIAATLLGRAHAVRHREAA